MKLLIVGSNGLVGKSLQKIFANSKKISQLVISTRKDTDLFNFIETKKLIDETKPNILINAAAKVGGIYANNTKRVDFIIENLKINTNLLEASIPYKNMVIYNLGSSCIYPLNAANPIKESSVMSGILEPTNSPYAMAKLTAIEIGQAISLQYGHKIVNLMPTNLYGPNDKFSEQDSHVIPGLIYRMHRAKINKDPNFKIWGSGNPLREFLFVEDLARAVEFLIDKETDQNIINIGSGDEISIFKLAMKIKKVTGYEGEVVFDSTMPDGINRKLLDSSFMNSLGWYPTIDLDIGLNKTYNWFIENLC